MFDQLEVDVAKLEVTVENLTGEVKELKAAVKQLTEAMNQGRGALWMLLLGAGFVGSLLSTVAKKLFG